MSKNDEKNITNLLSKKQQIVIETLEEIREDGSSRLLPVLIDLLSDSKSETVRNLIYKILCELKHTDTIPVLVEAIRNEKYSGIQGTLIRTCWENGLDYGPYLSTFVEIVITGSFMNAFEAFTVIENLEGPFPSEETEKMVEQLKISLETTPSDKKSLISDLIRILR